MAFSFFGRKGSSDKSEDSSKPAPAAEKIPEPTKPLSFEEALARQIQSKAESAALSAQQQAQSVVEPAGEIVFERAPTEQEAVVTAPTLAPTVAPVTSVASEPTPAPAPAPAPVISSAPVLSEAASKASTGEPVNAPNPSPQEPAVANTAQVSGAEQQEPAVQAPLVPATREDVIAAYKIFLDRLPESEEVITPRIGLARERILSSFMTSKYFLSRPKNIQLLLLTAIQIEQKANA